MIIRKIGRNGRWVKQIRRGGRILWECHEKKLKLSAPVIWLEGSADVVPESYTPAILGKAILGRTILGRTSVAAAKLAAPVIRLEVSSGKLDTPVIWLQEQQEIVKLDAPVIYLEEVADGGEEPDVPVVTKLNTPVIYFETMEDAEPEVPPTITATLDGDALSWNVVEGAVRYTVAAVPETGLSWSYVTDGVNADMKADVLNRADAGEYAVTVSAQDGSNIVLCTSAAVEYVYVPKLSTPAIYLETIEDETGEPIVTKLDTPIIAIYTVVDGELPEQGSGGPVKLETPEIWLETVEEEEPAVEKLAAPTIELVDVMDVPQLYIDGEYLRWNAVENATRYVLTCAGEDGMVNVKYIDMLDGSIATCILLSELIEGCTGPTYNIQIQAKNRTDTGVILASSEWSDILVYTVT